MIHKELKLYLSKKFLLLRFLLTGGPMVFFLFITWKAYEERATVGLIFGGGALLCFLLFIEQARLSYFIIFKIPVLTSDEQCLNDKLGGKTISWIDINDITFYIENKGKVPDRYILITLKGSEKTIKIRGRLVEADSNIDLRDSETIALLTDYRDKYGTKDSRYTTS